MDVDMQNTNTNSVSFVSTQLEAFYRGSMRANGTIYEERPGLISEIDCGSIAHFARHIGDSNPLWQNNENRKGSLAPPSILAAVRYPLLHGKSPGPDLTNLAAELEFRWFRSIRAGDRIGAVSRQTSVIPVAVDGEARSVRVRSVTSYTDSEGLLVAQANGVVVWRDVRRGGITTPNRVPRAYTTQEFDSIRKISLATRRSGPDGPPPHQRVIGAAMPPMLLPPLSVADIVLWEIAIGHPYRAGTEALLYAVSCPENHLRSNATGWPRHRSEAHIDHFAAGSRGMPLAFDNAIMRFARLSIALTDWIGVNGQLERLALRLHRPLFYGDTSLQEGRITGKREHPETTILDLELSISDWDGLLLASGEASVRIPSTDNSTIRK